MDYFKIDIEAAKAALYRDFKRGKINKNLWPAIENSFLNGFELGWYQVKEKPKETATYSLILLFLKDGIDSEKLVANVEYNSNNFGFALGVIISTIRHHQDEVIGKRSIYDNLKRILGSKKEYGWFVGQAFSQAGL